MVSGNNIIGRVTCEAVWIQVVLGYLFIGFGIINTNVYLVLYP